MPYDPRMLQMARMGVGMMGPQPPAFDNPANQPQAQRPKQWWEQAGAPSASGQPGDPSKPGTPPSLYDMLLNLGRMTRPQYDKAIQGPGAYGIAPKDAAMLGPWGFLGSMGLPEGAGWGGGGGGTPG